MKRIVAICCVTLLLSAPALLAAPALEVAIPVPAAEVTLAGELLLPDDASPTNRVAGVVLITGSGPQDRDETVMGRKPFKVLAEGLTNHGFAVLRYDDRGTKALGIGESTGSFAGSTTQDFAVDAAAAVEFLAGHPSVDSDRVVVCGHSTGGLVTAKLLAENRVPAAAVLLASPSVRGDALLANQLEVIALATQEHQGSPLTDEQLGRSNELQQELVYAAASDDAERLRAAGEAIVRFNLGFGGVDPDALTEAQMSAAIAQATVSLQDTWIAFFLRYDPRADLESSTVPVLAVYGGLDLQVTPDQNVGPMSAALRAAGHPQSAVLVLQQSNHLFQTAETGLIVEYGQLTDEMNPTLIDMTAAWLIRVVGPQPD